MPPRRTCRLARTSSRILLVSSKPGLLEAEVAQRLVLLEVVADGVALDVHHDQQLSVERYSQVLDVFPRLHFQRPARVAVQVEESGSISNGGK